MRLSALCFGWLALCGSLVLAAEESAPTDKVSYHQQIRPIFQTHCQGCHQPAKAGGLYIMTSFSQLLKGGETEDMPAVVPGKPDKSYLLEMITPVKGEASMPKGKPPLNEAELELIEKWISQGAVDDTPEAAKQRFDMEHPPLYSRPPVITSLDYSPDGTLLAVAGFHEVLLMSGDGSSRVARLVGMAQRIESVKFSPDGKFLAVTGGVPARMGEVQVWDVEKKALVLSVPMTFDTLYGGSWSPDGQLIAFGRADNSVRAIDAKTGQQVLFQGAHSDWVRDTVFSADGTHLVSVARDMTTKLTEVATQRFVDNVTSITPGALKGGILSVTRHPQRDEIIVGGSDGAAKVYRIHRLTKRVIGDDANLIRIMPALPGRIFSVAVSRDGKFIAAGSSLDGAGEVQVFNYDFDTSLPNDIKAINEKVVTQRSAEQKKQLEDYHTEGVKQISRTPLPQSAVYAICFHPNGQQLAVAGADGQVRLINTADGQIVKEFAPAPLSDPAAMAARENGPGNLGPALTVANREPTPKEMKVSSLSIEPGEVQINARYSYCQLVVTAQLTSGERLDVTRLINTQFSQPVANISSLGLVRPLADGEATLKVSFGGQSASVPVKVSGWQTPFQADFIRDVNPILSRLGCNAGTCHGAAAGKNGFKLSLRGYDSLFDIRAFTDDLASRRVNVASPDDSLMLAKPIGVSPHVGGVMLHPDDAYYAVIRNWIAAGAQLDLKTPRVTKIELFPHNPVVQQIGGSQQLRVMATYADGTTRDVTCEAFLESGNGDIASANRWGLMTALRRGEAPILVRYEGAYAATTLTVMGDREGFEWKQPPAFNRIDELTASKWQRMKILPSDVCTDAEYIRRVYLDLTGMPPTIADLNAFLADERNSRVKRDELVDKLIGSPDFVDYWTNKWADLLQVNRKFLGPEGASAFRGWIRERVEKNEPYDSFVRQILTASGSNRENPAASYFKVLRTPEDTMENTTHLFLAVRFNCNKCHDHPFERWTQDQYYQTAAYFARLDLQRDPASGNRNIGGTAVEGAKPLYEMVVDKPSGEVKHERTGQVTPPQFPYACDFESAEKATRRQELAAWMTSADNAYFAKSYVNRLWGYLFGVGIMEPIDDIRAGNPPTNPELLNFLTEEFLQQKFDMRHVLRLICKSRTYQLSVNTNRWNEDDRVNYSHAIARRLPAEVLYDAVQRVTGSVSRIPGVPAGTRASALPDSGVELPSGFLNKFGRPARESACECERSNGLELGPVMALISGPTIAEAIADPKSELPKLVAETKDDAELVNQLFLRILNRPATADETKATLSLVESIQKDHLAVTAALAKRQEEYKPILAQLEKDRLAAIAQAETDLAAYEKELAPKLAEMEQAKAAKTAKLVEDLQKYETALADHLAKWEKKQKTDLEWTPLEAQKLDSSFGATLTKLPDLSIYSEGKDGKGSYTITFHTDLPDITAFRLEVLPDDRLKSSGPGRAGDGNFVLSEFEVQAAPLGKPRESKKVDLQKPLADFSQQDYPIATAIDGRNNDNKGWAVSPSFGVVHWATFEAKQPVKHEGGTLLTVKFEHQFNRKEFLLGRFRLSVTTAKQPVGLSLAEDLRSILAVPTDERTEEQKTALLKHFQKTDGELIKKQQAVAESKKPLPIDPGLKARQDKLAEAKQPVPPDALLTQLTRDAEMSKQQLANMRLTLAQDLAWALINSPAFLFNH